MKIRLKRIGLFCMSITMAVQYSFSIELQSTAQPNPPMAVLPGLKLFSNQKLTPALNLADYNSDGSATGYSVITSFLSLSTITGSQVYQNGYPGITIGTNTFRITNSTGTTLSSSRVKYSTYKIKKLPQVVMRPGDSILINVAKYTIDSTGASVIPPTYGKPGGILSGNPSVLSALWANDSEISITTFSDFTTPITVDVLAAHSETEYQTDVDRERMKIYPAIATSAFEFNTSSDTTGLSYQVPAGAVMLPSMGYVSGITDLAGNSSNGGALKATFTNSSAGVKITPSFSSWLPNIAGSYYTLRVRIFGTSTTNNYIQYFYNGVPGASPTDIQGYFTYSVPTVWTYYDIPINSFSPVSSANVMYPQLVLQANGATGTIYIDEMEIFKGNPPIVETRSFPTDKYTGGYWNDASATSKWAIQTISGTPTLSYSSGLLQIVTVPNAALQTGVKFTASTAAGTIYTVKANIGKQAGMHMLTKMISGTPHITMTQIQVNMLGTTGPGSFTQAGDLATATEIGRISNRTMQLAFNPNSANYQVQFIVKSNGPATIQLDNTLADIDNDDPNYGDGTLFP